MAVKDMTGKTFGRLHVVARSQISKGGKAYWIYGWSIERALNTPVKGVV